MYRASQATCSPISRAALRTAAANSPGERCPRNARKARFGPDGRNAADDDAMAEPSLAGGAVVPVVPAGTDVLTPDGHETYRL
ncbi:hypothetical protein GCM10018773_01760 [Streptomyces candidus]|nr:hypothetical protein GCM10018773_01760 [Streptomyces candidus]